MSVGGARGGWSAPGPLWADKSELLGDPFPHLNQVVGHSPVEGCQAWASPEGGKVVFVDTFSTYPDGRHVGDCSAAVVEDGLVSSVDLVTGESKVLEARPFVPAAGRSNSSLLESIEELFENREY